MESHYLLQDEDNRAPVHCPVQLAVSGNEEQDEQDGANNYLEPIRKIGRLQNKGRNLWCLISYSHVCNPV